MTDRYDTIGLVEAKYQPGSNNEVLLNKLIITDPGEMDDVELQLLAQLTESLLDDIAADQLITAEDVCEWHRRWLGNVYEWAGNYRNVNMGKDGFQFAAANLIPGLMQAFSDRFLSVYTPCLDVDERQLSEALARVQIEFILIHPFRDGNGRLFRLLATVMALQAGYPPLDFS